MTTPPASASTDLEAELANLKESPRRADGAVGAGAQERCRSYRDLKAEIEQTRIEIERAQRAADYGRASELQYGKLVELEAQTRRTRASR